MTDDKQDMIYDILENLSSDELVSINNEYNSRTGLGCHIYEMEEFNDEYENCEPIEIAEHVLAKSFSSGDTYFTKDDWDDAESFDCLGDAIDCSDIAQYCVNDDEDFGNSDIRDILDKNDDFIIHVVDGEECEYMTLDQFEEKFDEDDIFEKDGEICDAVGWCCGIRNSEIDGSEITLTRFNMSKFIESCGFTNQVKVCKYYGYLFRHDNCFDEGRIFSYWYCPEADILLKVYTTSPTNPSVLYFKEMDSTYSHVIDLVKTCTRG